LPKKSWVEKAAESGDWKAPLAEAKKQLATSGAKILASRAPRDRLERCISRIGEDEAPEVQDASDDKVQEHVDDTYLEDADPLPSDQEEAALAPKEKQAPAVTLADAYQDYRERGGNRPLVKKVLEHLGSTPIDQLDRSAIIAASLQLYPKCLQSERHELVIDPLEEVVCSYKPPPVRPEGGFRNNPGAWDEYQYWTNRKVEREVEWAKVVAAHEWYRKHLWPPLEGVAKQTWETEEQWQASLDPFGLHHRPRWARLDPWPERKPDLRIPDIAWGTPKEQADHKLRGLLSATFHPYVREDTLTGNEEGGWYLEFGHRPGKKPGRPPEDPYYGYIPQRRGRPRKAGKLSGAEKAKRHRDKKRAKKAKAAARDHYLWMLERLNRTSYVRISTE
jgi:hypothetical protein